MKTAGAAALAIPVTYGASALSLPATSTAIAPGHPRDEGKDTPKIRLASSAGSVYVMVLQDGKQFGRI